MEGDENTMKRHARKVVELHREHHYLSMRVFIAATLFSFWLVTLHRPHLPHLYPTFQAFGSSENWGIWGDVGAILGILMLISRPGGIISPFVCFCASVYFFFSANLFTEGVGITTASTTYSLLGIGTVLMFGADFQQWLPKSRAFKHITKEPPKWFLKLRNEYHDAD